MTKKELMESLCLIGKYPNYFTEDIIRQIGAFDIYYLIMYSDCSTEKYLSLPKQNKMSWKHSTDLYLT